MQQPPEVVNAVSRVLSSGRYVKGPMVEEFEKVWAEKCGKQFGIGVGSGGQALEIAIQAIFPEGSIVSATKTTFKAVHNAIRRTGNLVSFEERPQIFAHHLHDQALDYKPMLEDCSHVHGYKPVADTAIFSFFPTKILGACGEAGAIVTDDPIIAQKCKEIRTHSEPKGTNGRMDEIQAAVLLAKLPYLDHWNQIRRTIVGLYDIGLGRKTPGKFHYAYCIPGSKTALQTLKDNEIESAFYYSPKYMALPLHPLLKATEVRKVIDVARKL